MEESTESAKKSLQQYISADRELGNRMNLDAIGLSEDDAAGLEALKDISKKQVRVLLLARAGCGWPGLAAGGHPHA